MRITTSRRAIVRQVPSQLKVLNRPGSIAVLWYNLTYNGPRLTPIPSGIDSDIREAQPQATNK